MTPQTKKIIAIVVCFVLAGVIFYWRMNQGEPETTTAKPQPAARGASAKTKVGGTKPAQTAAAPAAAEKSKSEFAQDIDIYALIRDVQEVNFDYSTASAKARNPMSPLVGANFVPSVGAKPQELQNLLERVSVTGIIWDEKNPLAVVNDEVVSPGTELPNGITVEAIYSDHVVLKVGEFSEPVYMKEKEQ